LRTSKNKKVYSGLSGKINGLKYDNLIMFLIKELIEKRNISPNIIMCFSGFVSLCHISCFAKVASDCGRL